MSPQQHSTQRSALEAETVTVDQDPTDGEDRDSRSREAAVQ